MPRRSVATAVPPFRILLLLALAVGGAATLHAQVQTTPSIIPRPGLSRDNQDDPFRDNPELRHRLEKGRAVERQKRIVDDANRLVALTAEYRKALDAHGKPTEEDQKLLVQIEKLAREVKDRMRGM